jgi:20S proteasome subunit alpha 4
MGYDSAITIFSPSGELLQVDYAAAAVKLGQCTIAIRCADCVLYGVVKSGASKLQIPGTINKIHKLDRNITTAFAGLNADARVLMNQARVEAQSYKLNYEDDPTIEYMAKHISTTLQKYTQKGGARPFGLSMYVAGMSTSGNKKFYFQNPKSLISDFFCLKFMLYQNFQ